MAYNDYTSDYMQWASANPNQYNYSYGLVDPGMAQANASIANAWRGEDMRRNASWANQQRMSDPAYWAQAFGAGGGASSLGENWYEKRLKNLLDNPDSIANSGAYKFAFNQGQEALNRQLAARGMLNSGNRLYELTKFGQGLASQQYGAEVDRLGNLAAQRTNAETQRYAVDQQGRNQLMSLAMQNSMRMQAPQTYQTPGGTLTRWW